MVILNCVTKNSTKNYLESDFDSNFYIKKWVCCSFKSMAKGILKEDILHNLNNKNSYVYEQFGNIGNKYFDELENGKKFTLIEFGDYIS